MKSPKTIILLLSLSAISIALALTGGKAQKPDRPDRPTTALRMSIIAAPPEKASGTPLFHVTIQNIGNKDVILNLGVMLANGKFLLPEAIRLVLTDPHGRARELHFSDKRFPGVAGRMDDYAIPLRSGSEYTVKLSLEDFWCPETKEFRLQLTPGEYQVRAVFWGKGAHHVNSDTKGLSLMHFWTGKLESDAATFRVGETG